MMVARVVLPSPGGPYSKTWSKASPRERVASMATARFSLTLAWAMNSARRCGRSFSSKEESSSTGAAETMRSRSCGILGTFLSVATGRMLPVLRCSMPDCHALGLNFAQLFEPGFAFGPVAVTGGGVDVSGIGNLDEAAAPGMCEELGPR